MTTATEDPCPHPARRLYSWIAFDGVLCVACCQCGTPLRGMVGDTYDRDWPEDPSIAEDRRRKRAVSEDDLPL